MLDEVERHRHAGLQCPRVCSRVSEQWRVVALASRERGQVQVTNSFRARHARARPHVLVRSGNPAQIGSDRIGSDALLRAVLPVTRLARDDSGAEAMERAGGVMAWKR